METENQPAPGNVFVRVARYLRHTRQDGVMVEYPPGTHEMPKDDAEHWFVKAHLADAVKEGPAAKGTEQYAQQVLEKKHQLLDLVRQCDAEIEACNALGITGNMNLQPDAQPNSTLRRPREDVIVDRAAPPAPAVDPETGTIGAADQTVLRTQERTTPSPSAGTQGGDVPQEGAPIAPGGDPAAQPTRPRPVGEDGDLEPEGPVNGEDPTSGNEPTITNAAGTGTGEVGAVAAPADGTKPASRQRAQLTPRT